MVDPADAAASDGVMIALLPTFSEWCNIELPHMTLVYAGVKQDLQPGDFNSLAKDAASIAMLSSKLVLKVIGVDIFGDEEKVNVLRFQPRPELLAMRRVVERWNASQHPFNPHATIGPVNEPVPPVPSMVVFDRIMVGWGDESITCWLG
jgi:2'-5' RNA ligase